MIGEAVMNGLREIDQLAYVRYASVYRRFEEQTILSSSKETGNKA